MNLTTPTTAVVPHSEPHVTMRLAQGPQPPDIEPPSNADRLLHAMIGELTQGLSPASLALAWIDWGMHLALSPAKWQQLVEKAWRKDLRWLDYTARSAFGLPAAPPVEPLPQDRRFTAAGWERWPYKQLQQAFLLNQQWWHNATTGIDGVTSHHEQVVEFSARQLLDIVSPVNFPVTNPEVFEATVREGGANLLRGAARLADDIERRAAGLPEAGGEAYRPGIEVAATPGRVVFRNRLIELIQYQPATPAVHAEPLLIVPAWIMKYYILDLSPHNSLVRYMVDHGHTVFMISWHNPGAHDADLGMDDYLHQGIQAATSAIGALLPGHKVNLAGYCLGGTLAAIAAAADGCDERRDYNTLTMLAAQTDFSEAGELMLFIDEGQIAWLEDLMWKQGYLDNRQMAGAFRLLRSNDLVWSLLVRHYLLGERPQMTDLMAWNADTTRMPARMHSDYLRRLFLENDLFAGRYRVGGRPISLGDIRLPLFAVATETDHVSPWRSVHKIHLAAGCEVQFVLTSGGHNAGIVSEPGHRGRHYLTARRACGDCYVDPEGWLALAVRHEGTWWPEWLKWLERVNSGAKVPARAAGPGLGPAPGSYVLER